MINQFDIGIWDESENQAEPLSTYLEKYNAGSYQGWKSDLKSSQLLIKLNGKSYEPYTGCFVEMVGRQFLLVYDRLKNNQAAFPLFDYSKFVPQEWRFSNDNNFSGDYVKLLQDCFIIGGWENPRDGGENEHSIEEI